MNKHKILLIEDNAEISEIMKLFAQLTDRKPVINLLCLRLA